VIFCTFPSVLPVAGSTSVDFSWIAGLNEAVRRHLVFGKDVVYTYGPLTFVAWPMDIGINLPTAVGFRLAIHGLFWLAIALGFKACRQGAFGCLFVAGIALSGVGRDTEYVVVASVLIYLTCAAVERQPWAAVPAAVLTAVAILIKFNVGVTCVLADVAWVLVQLSPAGRQSRFGLPLAVFAAAGSASFLVLFRVYGGPLSALGDFFRYSFLLASGYSAQLAVRGQSQDYWFAALLTCLLVGTALERALRADRRFLIIPFLLAAPLFMTLKGGLVRQDSWHVWYLIEALAAFTCLLLLIPCEPSKRIPVAAVVAVALGMSMYWHRQQELPNHFRPVLPQGPGNLLALARWPTERADARAKAEEFRREQAIKYPLLPAMLRRIEDATVDAYPTATYLVVANQLNWSPRLVFQSHIVYVPELDEANAEHYRSGYAPRFILFRTYTIDEEHPMAVDPLTWLELYRWYDAVEWTGWLGLLQRRTRPRFGRPLLRGRCSLPLGKRWQLPDPGRQPLLLRAKLQLTRLGALRDKLYKVYPPTMTIDYKDGKTFRCRLVWRNVANGFFVNDLPITAEQTEAFWRRGVSAPVKSISFQADRRCFDGTVNLEWFTLPLDNQEKAVD
jgi:hypothetical protein